MWGLFSTSFLLALSPGPGTLSSLTPHLATSPAPFLYWLLISLVGQKSLAKAPGGRKGSSLSYSLRGMLTVEGKAPA